MLKHTTNIVLLSLLLCRKDVQAVLALQGSYATVVNCIHTENMHCPLASALYVATLLVCVNCMT